MSELKDKILEERKNGNIVFDSAFGLHSTNLKSFIEQPTEWILYDLNRDDATVLTFINEPKWVNDFAVCQVIRALKNRISELEQSVG